MRLLQDIHQLVSDLGGRVGVTDLAAFEDVAVLMSERNEDGRSGSLKFTYRDVAVSTQPAVSFAWGRSVVVIAMPYIRDGDGISGDRTVARFADGDRYEGLRNTLEAVSHHLAMHGFQAEAVFDDERLVDRALAQRAGVGWIGKSSMILTPGFGPWVLLGSVVTDAVLPISEPMVRNCGTCDACMPACPTGAIVAPGILDARLCLSAIFQMREDIPFELRPLAGSRIYGCDDCLTSCPPGDSALRSVTTPSHRALMPQDVLSMNDHDLGRTTAHWYVPGHQMRYIRRNALVALGNSGGPADIGTAAGYAGHPNPMLRRHALWALNALSRETFASVATLLGKNDPDADVRRDVERITLSEMGRTTRGEPRLA